MAKSETTYDLLLEQMEVSYKKYITLIFWKIVTRSILRRVFDSFMFALDNLKSSVIILKDSFEIPFLPRAYDTVELFQA